MEGDQYQTMVQNQTKFLGQMFEVESEAKSGIFLTGLRDTKCSRLAVTCYSDSMWFAACPPYLWGDVFLLKVNQCIQVEQAQVWCGQRRPEIALEKWLATQTSKCHWSLDSDELCIFAWGVCIIQSANACHSFDHTLLCFPFSRSIVSDTFSAHVHSVSATVEHSRTQFHVKGMTALHTTYTTQRFPTKWLSCLFLMPVIVCLDPKQRQR